MVFFQKTFGKLAGKPDMTKIRNPHPISEKGWYELDNAAKLFPAIISRDLTSVFRITAILKSPVKYKSLKEAVSITSGRFPYFNVSLGSGLFWHYLEFNGSQPRILAEEETPCTAFAVSRKDEPLYRIVVRSNRISVEFIHILTDGSGALEYLKSLLYTYFSLSGNKLNDTGEILLPGTPVSKEEYEDGYLKFFRKLPPPAKLDKAWHLPFQLNQRPRLKVLHAEIKTAELLELSRRYKVSITEYFLAVYFYSLQTIFIAQNENERKRRRKVLRIELPVNMRNKVSSRTMRNFSLFVLPEIDLRLGTYTFEEILTSVYHQLRISSDVKQISRSLSKNVSYEKLFLIRILPLFIKKLAIAAIYRGLASKRFTGIVTNLGNVSLPQDMADLIDNFEIIPPPPNPRIKVCAAIVSFRDLLRISFCNITGSNELERLILSHLAREGVHVKIMNNNFSRI